MSKGREGEKREKKRDELFMYEVLQGLMHGMDAKAKSSCAGLRIFLMACVNMRFLGLLLLT